MDTKGESNCVNEAKDLSGIVALYENLGNLYMQKEQVENRFVFSYLIALGLIFWAFYSSPNLLSILNNDNLQTNLLTGLIKLISSAALLVSLVCVLFWIHRIQISQKKITQQLLALRGVIFRSYGEELFDKDIFQSANEINPKRAYWSYKYYVIVLLLFTVIVEILVLSKLQ